MKKILKALAFLSLVALAAIAAVKLPDWIAAGGKDAGGRRSALPHNVASER